MFGLKRFRKKIWLTLGICFLTGSFCACGDDTSVIVSMSDIQEQIPNQQEVKENIEINRQGQDVQETVSGSEIASQSTPTATPTPQPKEIAVTISAAGDVTLGNYPEQAGYSIHQVYEQQGDAYFFENVWDTFSQDDMTLVNLEGVLTNATEKRENQTYCLKGKPEYVKALTEGSVEAVSMANNHRLDYLQVGSDETVEQLEEAGIVYAYDSNLGIYEVKGIRIGYISVNWLSHGQGVETLIQDGIAKLKEEDTDLILVCCHWGIEREYFPEGYQQALGRNCIDWGADLVIGHHPHVLQGVEEYNGKFIVYSLGNFCFGANRNPEDKDTMIFQQTFTFVEGEKQEDKNIRIIPCSISSVSGINDFRPTPVIGEEEQRIIEKINEFSKDFGVEFDSDGRLLQ